MQTVFTRTTAAGAKRAYSYLRHRNILSSVKQDDGRRLLTAYVPGTMTADQVAEVMEAALADHTHTPVKPGSAT